MGLSGAHVPISRGPDDPDVGAQLRISFEDFLRAYEASLRTDRLRAVGDLESSAQISWHRCVEPVGSVGNWQLQRCAFRYFAGDAQSIHIDTLEVREKCLEMCS